MATSDYTTKKTDELQKELKDLQTEKGKILFSFASGATGELDKYRGIRKMVARIKTELRRRELAGDMEAS